MLLIINVVPTFKLKYFKASTVLAVCFPALTARRAADYLDQVCSFNQKVETSDEANQQQAGLGELEADGG